MNGQSTRKDINDPYAALALMTEATLATISELANRSRPPRRELTRQIEIAQTGITVLKEDLLRIADVEVPWVIEIINGHIDVKTWCEKWQ